MSTLMVPVSEASAGGLRGYGGKSNNPPRDAGWGVSKGETHTEFRVVFRDGIKTMLVVPIRKEGRPSPLAILVARNQP